MTTQAISVAEPQQKLRELEKQLPTQQDAIYEFGRFVADRLNTEIHPLGFVMACELAIYDLQNGVDGFSSQPIRSQLVGYPPQTYQGMKMWIPIIAKAAFSEEFAAEVKHLCEQQGSQE